MRRVVVPLPTTLNNRIANAEGGFWEPFPFGDAEQAYINDFSHTLETTATRLVVTGDLALEPAEAKSSTPAPSS